MTDNNDIIEESNHYYLTVLDYRKNIDIEFLTSIPNKEKFELLINAYCDPKCLFRSEHYNRLSLIQLNNNTNNIQDIECSKVKHSFFEALNFPTVIKVEDLYTLYKDLGFIHFKIEGRTNHIIDVLESYLYYMVKPEYYNLVRYNVLK